MPEQPSPQNDQPQLVVTDRETDTDGDFTVTFELRPPRPTA